jgi:hypothetical protein
MEYVTILIVAIGSFIAVQQYIKRGIQGRWKQSVDQIGEQYDPQVADSSVIHQITVDTETTIITTNTVNGFWTTRRDLTNSTETKTGTRTISAY